MNEIDAHKSCDQIHIIEKLLHLGKLIMGRLDGALEEVELSEAKFWALKHLIESNECLGVTQLADCMGSVKSNATQIIDRLETEGLVQRLPNPTDRRSVLVEVTDEGLKRYQAGVDVRLKMAEILVSELDENEQADLSKYLAAIFKSV